MTSTQQAAKAFHRLYLNVQKSHVKGHVAAMYACDVVNFCLNRFISRD